MEKDKIGKTLSKGSSIIVRFFSGILSKKKKKTEDMMDDPDTVAEIDLDDLGAQETVTDKSEADTLAETVTGAESSSSEIDLTALGEGMDLTGAISSEERKLLEKKTGDFKVNLSNKEDQEDSEEEPKEESSGEGKSLKNLIIRSVLIVLVVIISISIASEYLNISSIEDVKKMVLGDAPEEILTQSLSIPKKESVIKKEVVKPPSEENKGTYEVKDQIEIVGGEEQTNEIQTPPIEEKTKEIEDKKIVDEQGEGEMFFQDEEDKSQIAKQEQSTDQGYDQVEMIQNQENTKNEVINQQEDDGLVDTSEDDGPGPFDENTEEDTKDDLVAGNENNEEIKFDENEVVDTDTKDSKEAKKEEKQLPPLYDTFGRGLVYNCVSKHWACVDRREFIQCYRNQLWSSENSEAPSCITVQVYADNEGCNYMQLEKINYLAKTGFCNL